MRYTPKTIEREVVGPFTGKRFLSMSDDVVDALLTVEYRFEGFTITIIGIPARWDRTTGAEYITGKVGRAVNERVTTLAAILERQKKRDTERLRMEILQRPFDTAPLQVERRLLPTEQMIQTEGRLNRERMIAEVLQVTPLRLSLNLRHAA
jgi:hypothetical protein